jgi:FHS family L-fucose permease-like MFS transporter
VRVKHACVGALAIAVSLFFFWGFVAASNGIFIPFCRTHFHLTQLESQLIGSAFYGAYFVGSLALYAVATLTGRDLFNRFGYKRMIIFGLSVSAVGALLIVASASTSSFPAVLGAFFVVALGFSVQQTAAQPFIIGLGPIATGAHRLNLAGSVNSLGTILGPIVLSFALFGTRSAPADSVTIGSIRIIYVVVAAIFAGVALFFHVSHLPEQKEDAPPAAGVGALMLPQVLLGALGIFLYVGVEVTVDNNFGALLRTPGYLTAAGLADRDISKYISLYWGSVMIGRWAGAVAVFDLRGMERRLATVAAPFAAFAIVLGVNRFYGNTIDDLYAYAVCVAVAVAAILFGQEKPVKTLYTVTLLATVAALLGVFTSGLVSVYCFMATGLFCSVMWPCIFNIALTNVGPLKGQASALLIMMILGGAIIPPFQGWVGDVTHDMHFSYVVAAGCFAALFLLTWPLSKAAKFENP